MEREAPPGDALDEGGERGLGHLLKTGRGESGLSQDDLASRAAVSKRTICEVEKGVGGRRLVSLSALVRLAYVLGHDPQEFLAVEGYTIPSDKLSVLKRVAMTKLSKEPPPIEGKVIDLLREESALGRRVERGEPWEVWRVNPHYPMELDVPEALDVVSRNVQSGVDYRYFLPAIPEGNPQWPVSNASNIEELRGQVRKRLSASSQESIAQRVRGYSIDPSMFPLFMNNGMTVVHFNGRLAIFDATQVCYQIILTRQKLNAWYYREGEVATVETIRALQQAICDVTGKGTN